ncbi:acyltransferase family protein [Nitrospirota bacterium]
MNKTPPVKYFHGLNELRAIAALCILISHLEQFKWFFGFEQQLRPQFLIHMASMGVTFFFVLSGFLVTYRLLVEKQLHGTILLKDFFFRRALRIWPLYLLLLFISFFLLPHMGFLALTDTSKTLRSVGSWDFGFRFALYLSMMPNIAYVLNLKVPYLVQSWAIGVEEHFYLFWPGIIKRTKANLKTFAISFLLVYGFTILAYMAYKLSLGGSGNTLAKTLKIIFDYMMLGRFTAFIIGGAGAYILHRNKTSVLRYIRNRPSAILSCILTITLILLGIKFTPLTNEVYSFLFLMIILNVSASNWKIRFLDYLGRISYGIYMYHLLAIGLVGAVIRELSIGSAIYLNIVSYLSTILVTIILSDLSYRWFESRFIKMKSRYKRI